LYNSAGLGIIDINNDGLQDVFFASTMNACKLYLNKGNFKPVYARNSGFWATKEARSLLLFTDKKGARRLLVGNSNGPVQGFYVEITTAKYAAKTQVFHRIFCYLTHLQPF
jgi:hypothetical protein